MPISDLSRRHLLSCIAAVPALGLASTAQALSEGDARDLIDRVMAEVHGIINSGQSESRMIARFERLFGDYADVPAIARSALGPPARSASAGQLSAFSDAFQGYMARKYGSQFRRFIGATVRVEGAREVQRYFEVNTTMTLRGQAPFEVRWHVSDRSGRPLFFNLIIEGVNLLATERQEIGTMLERRGGNISALITDLGSAG